MHRKRLILESFPLNFFFFLVRIEFLFNTSATTQGEGEFICILYPVLILREKSYKFLIRFL